MWNADVLEPKGSERTRWAGVPKRATKLMISHDGLEKRSEVVKFMKSGMTSRYGKETPAKGFRRK